MIASDTNVKLNFGAVACGGGGGKSQFIRFGQDVGIQGKMNVIGVKWRRIKGKKKKWKKGKQSQHLYRHKKQILYVEEGGKLLYPLHPFPSMAAVSSGDIIFLGDRSPLFNLDISAQQFESCRWKGLRRE